jgi:hypothetical protein
MLNKNFFIINNIKKKHINNVKKHIYNVKKPAQKSSNLFTFIKSNKTIITTNNSITFTLPKQNVSYNVKTLEKYNCMFNGVYFQCSLPNLNQIKYSAKLNITCGTQIFYGKIFYDNKTKKNMIRCFFQNGKSKIIIPNNIGQTNFPYNPNSILQIYSSSNYTNFYINGKFLCKIKLLNNLPPLRAYFTANNIRNKNKIYKIKFNNIAIYITGKDQQEQINVLTDDLNKIKSLLNTTFSVEL